ncbi:MAG: hypothetical protein GWP45_03350, partial [Proteobacteria bacterium]|nr:hypothetical protein [Pseudomonadota bacterium]
MNTTSSSSVSKRPIEWRRAFSAMRRLIKNPDATDEVFIIIEALSGDSLRKGFSRFVTTNLGRRVLVDRRSLLETLLNREYLATLPQHSLAAHYLSFVTKENISAKGLVEPSESMRAM